MNKKQIKELDKLWSKAVRQVGHCEKCGGTYRLQAAHILSRRHHAVRWLLLNGICLCYRCHMFWAHKDPLDFVRWLEDVRGVKTLENLRLLSRPEIFGGCRAKELDYEEVKRTLV